MSTSNAHALQPRPLGSTGVMVAALSIGTSRIGSDQPIGTATSEQAIQTAVDLLQGDFPLIDTSNNYGDGRSEGTIGLAIARLGGIPRGHTVATKADADPTTGVFDADRIRRSFEESASRLGVEHFPIYHLHDPYSITVGQAASKGGALEGLISLKDQGLVGAIGIASGPIGQLREYLDTGAFDVLLTHNRYTILDRSAEDLISTAASRNIAVFNAAAFGGGLLVKGSKSGAHYAYSPASAEILAWLERLEAVCLEWSVELPAAALQFSMRNSAISSTLVGTSNSARLTGLAAMATVDIPEGFWTAVTQLGLPPLASQGVEN